MPDLKQEIKSSHKSVYCFNIINNSKSARYGLKCGRLLLKKNSSGEAAAQIKCPICKALYDIKDNRQILISRGDKK